MRTPEPSRPPRTSDAYDPPTRSEEIEGAASRVGLVVAAAVRAVDVVAVVLLALLVCPPLMILVVVVVVPLVATAVLVSLAAVVLVTPYLAVRHLRGHPGAHGPLLVHRLREAARALLALLPHRVVVDARNAGKHAWARARLATTSQRRKYVNMRVVDVVDLTSALATARLAAVEAGGVAHGAFRMGAAKRRKQDGTWVTEADLAAERILRERLTNAHPTFNVVGEEGGLTGPDGGAARRGAPTWVVDPIDGTANFVDGIPIWATLVALVIDEKPCVGVVHAPALGETYDAAAGLGARCNDEPIAVAGAVALDEATVLYGTDHGFRAEGFGAFYDALGPRVGRLRGLGDFWGHMLVARGAAHAMIEPHSSLAPWDAAALQPILEEAGARLLGPDGQDWGAGQPAFSAGPAIAAELTALWVATGADHSDGA